MLTLEKAKGEAMSIPQPVAPELGDILMTAEELAQRWRCDTATLANARSAGEGCPYIKVTGGIRYRAADVMAFEVAKTKGFTWPKLQAALQDFPALSTLQRQDLIAHLKARLK